MQYQNIELIKEDFDLWDRSHIFWHFSDSPYYRQAKDTCPFISNKLHEKEIDILIYIWHSLIDRQEYDAGNSILIATQTGILSSESIENIITYIINENVIFTSKIGNIIYGAIARSIGLWLYMSGRKDTGKKLWQLGIDSAKTMQFRKNIEIQKWRVLPERCSMPIELKNILDELA
jgi:hypothetical protein